MFLELDSAEKKNSTMKDAADCGLAVKTHVQRETLPRSLFRKHVGRKLSSHARLIMTAIVLIFIFRWASVPKSGAVHGVSAAGPNSQRFGLG